MTNARYFVDPCVMNRSWTVPCLGLHQGTHSCDDNPLMRNEAAQLSEMFIDSLTFIAELPFGGCCFQLEMSPGVQNKQSAYFKLLWQKEVSTSAGTHIKNLVDHGQSWLIFQQHPSTIWNASADHTSSTAESRPFPSTAYFRGQIGRTTQRVEREKCFHAWSWICNWTTKAVSARSKVLQLVRSQKPRQKIPWAQHGCYQGTDIGD